MTTLITGGAGYIGAHMALDLVDRGEPVVVLDDLSTGHRWSVPGGAVFIQGDVGDQALIASLIKQHGVHAIVHFAAKTVVPDSVADPLGYYLANTVKSRAMLEAAYNAGVRRIVFSSTAAVYGEPGDAPVAEDSPLRPLSPYGWSKLMTEQMLRDVAAASDLRFVALRYFNVAGADPAGRAGQSTPRATHLIKIAAETVVGKRQQIEVFGTDYPTRDGACVRDYIHVTDLIAAHAAALDYLAAGNPSLTCNCGYGRGYSVREVIAAVKSVSGLDFPVVERPRRAGDSASVVADPSLARARLGWTPRYDDLNTIIAHAVAWERTLQKRG
jgi:UDP-glucose 4-epimerase